MRTMVYGTTILPLIVWITLPFEWLLLSFHSSVLFFILRQLFRGNKKFFTAFYVHFSALGIADVCNYWTISATYVQRRGNYVYELGLGGWVARLFRKATPNNET